MGHGVLVVSRATPRHCLILLLERSTVLRSLWISRSDADGPPPLDPFFLRWAIWTLHTGLVCLFRCVRRT